MTVDELRKSAAGKRAEIFQELVQNKDVSVASDLADSIPSTSEVLKELQSKVRAASTVAAKPKINPVTGKPY